MVNLDWATAPGLANMVGVLGKARSGRDLPVLPPDFIGGMDHRDFPSNYRAHKFCDRLKTSSCARESYRHYVDWAGHFYLPESCWIIVTKAHILISLCMYIHELFLGRGISCCWPEGGGQNWLGTERW